MSLDGELEGDGWTSRPSPASRWPRCSATPATSTAHCTRLIAALSVQIGEIRHQISGMEVAATAARALEVAYARGSRLVEARALHLAGLLDPAAAEHDRVAALLTDVGTDVGTASPDVVPETRSTSEFGQGP